MNINKYFFEKEYKKFNKKEFLYSDPLSFVYKYKNKNEQEIVALISSSLAYGNVKQILRSLNLIFSKMKESPINFIEKSTDKKIFNTFSDFKHRFTTGKEFSVFLLNIKKTLKKYKKLENLFFKNYKEKDENIVSSLYSFVNEFTFSNLTPTLIPSPNKESSFKRFNLFLRWMIRKDEIDLGLWQNISPSKLIIPLDTHMFQLSKKLNLTKRNNTSMKTAIEITNFFKTINPKDPIKYDFSLTRTPILKTNFHI